jgi:LPS-assembly lipoprotein
MRRNFLSATLLLLCAVTASCGFQLRGRSDFAFKTLHTGFAENSPLGNELKRTIVAGSDTRIVAAEKDAQAVMDVLADTREKVVLGTNASGQVREFQLRMRLKFKLRSPQGKELIPESELLVTRDVAFSESAVLAKESEEQLLYRAMQTDLVQQVMRRLAAVKSL